MAERRVATKGRRMGSSRRKQLREGYGEALAPGPGEEPPWATEIVQKVQDFFKERDEDQAGFVTRSDMQKLQEEGLLCSMEELELVFDGLDAAGTGRLSIEDFTAGFRQFLSSQKVARDHRRRKTASRRVRLVLPSPTLEEVNSEERRHFAAFMDQLGMDNVSDEQEIWQLWVKLRQDEPQLLGNLEDFLAKMRHRIQEARSKKEALEVTLNRRVAEHDQEVQQLCEALEQQIQQEQQRLQQESVARSHQHSLELQQALDASEREVQRLVTAQMELETRCRSLRSTQQAASTENRQLEESNRELEDRLQHLHQQLQQTQGRLQTARASVVWERAEEPRDRAVTELPGEVPLSPQTSPEKSEKHGSERRIRLGSQSDEPKAKSTHQVVWEMPPADINLSVVPRRASSAEEDPFPEFLKEEHFSDQSSLLREMNDAIAALSKQLKPQAPGAPPTLVDAAHHPRDDAEPQTEPEAATAHGKTPGVLRETFPGHIGHQVVEGDLKEGPGTAELRASDVTQAGASVGAGHHRAQEPGTEQGESPEEARRMLFLQGKGPGVKELVLKVAEHPQGAPGESAEAGEQALMEAEGEGWMQEKARDPGEAEEVALGWGQGLEAGLGPPEAGLAAGWQLVTDELGLAVAPEEHAQPLGTGLGEEAHPPSGLSKKLEINPGECLEPEPPSPGEPRMGAAHEDGVLPEVTAAPDPRMLEEEHVEAEVEPQGQTGDAEELPAQAQRGGSSRAGAEEGDVEVPQPQGESARGEAARGGSVGPEVPGAVPPSDLQEGRVGPDVPPLEAQSRDVNLQRLPEVEADLQPPSEASSLATEQRGSVAPDVEPLDQVNKPELVERVEAEDSQADVELHGGPSLETLQGGEDNAAVQLGEEAEDGAQGQDEHELPHEPVLDPRGAGVGQREGAGAGVQSWEEAGILDTLEARNADANVQLIAEVEEFKLTPGGGTEADLQPLSEAGALWAEQGERVAPDVQPLDQVDKPELVEMEAEDSQADMELSGGPSLETLEGKGDRATTQLMEEAEDGAQGQDEHELPHEPVLDPQGAAVGQREGAGARVQPWEEAGILDTLEARNADANVQLIAEVEELKSASGGSKEADLAPLGEAGALWTEQGGSVAPDVELLDQVDKPELVEMEAEDSQADVELCEGPTIETLEGEGERAATQLMEEAEDGAQGQDEHELPHEPVLDPQGAGVGQGEGAGADVQPQEEAGILDTLEARNADANVQLIAEVDEFKLTPGGGTEADLQPLSEAGALWAEQGESVAPDVELLDQVDKPELVEMEAEDSQADMELSGGPSLETLQGGEDHAAVQLGEEAGILDTLETQSTDANVQLIAEVEEQKVTPGGGMETDLQLSSEVSSLGTEQVGRVTRDIEPLDQVDKPELVEMEAEDSQADMELCEGPTIETLEGEGDRAATQLMEEAEDGAQGQDEHELPHEPVLDPQGAGVGQREGAGADVQPREEAGILDTLESQSTDANVQLIAEVEELKLTPGGGMETDVQLSSGVSSPDTEQGGSVAPDVQEPDQVDKPALVEMEAEDSPQADMELHGSAIPENPQGRGDHTAIQLGEKAENGAQGQDESGLAQEPVLDPHGVTIRQGEGAGADMQPPEEGEILDVLEDQSTDANVQLIAEVEELKLTPGGSTEANLQPLSEAGSLDTEQGERVAPDVQPLDQVGKPELVEMEAEDSQADMELSGGPSLETLQGGEDHAAVQLGEEAGILDTLETQSTDANVQLIAEVEEQKVTPGGGTETDLQLSSEVSSLGTEQVGRVTRDIEPLDQVDKPELVEMEAEDSQADMELSDGPSTEAPWGGQGRAATQLMEEAEDGAQGQDEHELPHEPVLDPQGAGVGQREGAGADVQPREEAGILDMLEARNADANVQLIAEVEELKSASGGSKEADLAPLGEAGMWKEEQSQTPGSVAGPCAVHTPDAWGGAAGAGVSPPAEATLCPEGDAAAEGPDGQILGDTQALELPQGERAVAGGRPLDGAQGLEVVQGERLEAGARTLVETQNLGLKQGHDDGVSELASPDSKVPVQITTLKLETVMQKDVLIPDVRRLGASGQAAQSELQEQVSAQADKVRLHTASQQLEEKPSRVMETEQVAARPAEPPKQEVPPMSTPHQQVQQEGAGNDQLGMVLGDRSLGYAANSSLQLQRKLLGEQSEDLSVGQREKQQEAGKKTSQKGEPSPGEPGAGTADGAGAAPRGPAEASLDPDHLYNVLFIGDSNVGKTSFLYRLHANAFNPHLAATVGMDYQIKNLMVDNKHFALRLWDSAGQERYRSVTKQFFRKADGVVLMYDITSEYSFSDTRYWLSCIQEGAEDGVVILLLGNKTDCAAERQVPTEEGERLAKEYQLTFYECSAASGHNVAESMVSLVRLLKVREDELKIKAKEVPKPPQKKKGCCW